MIKRIVWIFVVLPLAVLLVAFAVANRGRVVLSLDPFSPTDPAIGLEMPLYLLFFLTLIAGVVIGGAAAWLTQGKWRKQARQQRNEAARWRERAETAQAQAAGQEQAARQALPAPR